MNGILKESGIEIVSVRSRRMKVGDPNRNKLHDKCILTVNYGDDRR